MNITESATLLIEEIIQRTGGRMMDANRIVRVLSVLYPEASRSSVVELVDDTIGQQSIASRRH